VRAAAGVISSASTGSKLIAALDAATEIPDARWCEVTLVTPAAVQTLVGQVIGCPITSGRRAGSLKVRPVALRRVYGGQPALSLLEQEPSMGWMHDPNVCSEVDVFSDNAPTLFVPDGMARDVRAEDQTIIGLLRGLHGTRDASLRTEDHFAHLEAFYWL